MIIFTNSLERFQQFIIIYLPWNCCEGVLGLLTRKMELYHKGYEYFQLNEISI